MTVQSDLQKQKVERLAKSQGITAAEYKRRCEINTAKNKGLTPAEYAKKKLSDSAKKKEITVAEYRKCVQKKVHGIKVFEAGRSMTGRGIEQKPFIYPSSNIVIH